MCDRCALPWCLDREACVLHQPGYRPTEAELENVGHVVREFEAQAQAWQVEDAAFEDEYRSAIKRKRGKAHG